MTSLTAELALVHARWLTRERLALTVLLVATAALYFVNPTVNGWANIYYSAAVQAGSVDWTAFLYGSSDAANSITVDKPPASLWLMALSVRAFGLNPVAIMLPQALIGVATVATVYATVRRAFPAPTALLAGTILATMPVATLMFRYNNPDALLVLLLTLATYFTARGIEQPRCLWMVLAGAAAGFGFLTKELQAFLVLPVLVISYLLAARTSVRRRVTHLLAALGALVVSAGWWVALVSFVPADARPFVGGSQTNNFLDVVLGYNGLGRIVGGSFGNGSDSVRTTGIDRLLSGSLAGQIGWLLPASVLLLALALLIYGRSPKWALQRTTLVLFGGSLVVTGLALSFMSGIFHGYYTLALAPSIGAVFAIGATALWKARRELRARIVLAVVGAGSAGWAFAVLQQHPGFLPGLGSIVLGAGILTAVLIASPPRLMLNTFGATLGVLALLAGPLAYSVQTTTAIHTGSGPIAGPGTGESPRGNIPSYGSAALSANASSYTWLAAVVGSTLAGDLQLATGHPVMPVGGYKRTDPAPTLEHFQELVAAKRIHWFLPGVSGGTSQSALISRWVVANFEKTAVGGIEVYDLSQTPSVQLSGVSSVSISSL